MSIAEIKELKQEMRVLKEDITKLKTIRNYASMIKKTVVWMYELGKRGEINVIEIDGVKFVKID